MWLDTGQMMVKPDRCGLFKIELSLMSFPSVVCGLEVLLDSEFTFVPHIDQMLLPREATQIHFSLTDFQD